MSDTERASTEARVATAPFDDAPLRCQICGARQEPPDRVLCAACGEPVLRWGWAP